jgi:hypothetical protein
MKRVIAIFCLLTYLFGGTDASQVIKFPLLVKHYFKHRQADPSLTVISFLKMHYVGKQPLDADYQQDMQLPFKTCVDVFIANPPTILPVVPQLCYNGPVVIRVKHTLLDDRAPLYTFPQSIFQPPKA